MKPSDRDLNDLVERLVSSVRPLRIILFGSAARDELGPHSDLDLLVVVADGSDCRDVARTAYRALRGFPYAKDIIAVQQSDFQKHAGNPYLVIHDAIRDGKELYRAAS